MSGALIRALFSPGFFSPGFRLGFFFVCFRVAVGAGAVYPSGRVLPAQFTVKMDTGKGQKRDVEPSSATGAFVRVAIGNP